MNLGMIVQFQQMRPVLKIILKIFFILLVSSSLLAWLELTPPGLLGKMDAIGYAVCHQIPGRSFFLSERQLPLCARCSGMYLGACIGLLYFFKGGKTGGLP